MNEESPMRYVKEKSIVGCLFVLFLVVPSISSADGGKDGSPLSPGIVGLLLLNQNNFVSPATEAHESIEEWIGTATCLSCHMEEAKEIFGSSHYQWLGETPYMTNGPDLQGKLDLGVNSYCINITGNWNGCSACHVGLGLRPEATESNTQLANIDCLICHQEGYVRKKVEGVFVPDEANMSMSMLEAAQTVHLPNRVTCLQCHAKGGGGDNYKRGDMALAHGNTNDTTFDVHMAKSGGDLSCQECHTTENHRMAGRGSDLRPTDLDVAMNCYQCHDESGQGSGEHSSGTIRRHLARVACQTCHIPVFAKNANDTPADEKTEVHRDWLLPHPTASGAIHPTPTMAGNQDPRYAWWNGFSSSYLLGDPAQVDPLTGYIPTSRPEGAVDDNNAKLYPFKYKTANQPLLSSENLLIALDTSVYFVSGNADDSIRSGLANMGYPEGSPYEWVWTDTMQLITHEVPPSSQALQCSDCHDNSTRMDLINDLGYGLKDSRAVICVQCHEEEDDESGPEYVWVHEEHVEREEFDCSWCHGFSRPERGLEKP